MRLIQEETETMGGFYGDEISRFTASGKTFFFNRQVGKTGNPYGVINTMYGQGMRERITVLPSQAIEFSHHARGLAEELCGVRMDPEAVEEPQEVPMDCSACGREPQHDWGVKADPEGGWYVVCECGEVIMRVTEEKNG